MTPLLDYWKPVVGYEGRYEVSSVGSIRTNTKCRGKSKSYPFMSPRITRTGDTVGYLQINLFRGGSYKGPLVHRIVAAAFIGVCPDGYEVNHKDGVKTNCRLSNLEYVTSSANKQHVLAMGLRSKGSEMANAKLTEGIVREMKKLRETMPYADIARLYGVATTTARHAMVGKTWKHVS